MPTKKTEDTIRVLRLVWGGDIPAYPGSPQEETPLDDAELILHELGHQLLIRHTLRPGFIYDDYEVVAAHLEAIEESVGYMCDFHEMRAVAIELVAAKKLGLRINHNNVIENSADNTMFFSRSHGSRAADRYRLDVYKKLVKRLKTAPSTHRKADIIVALVERVRKEGL